MGVDDDFAGIGATTMPLVRARIVAHDADTRLFEATLAKAVEAGIFKGPLTAIIDSSPVHGAGNVADTYELIRKMAAKVARAMGERLDAGPARHASELGASRPDIDWGDPAVRKVHLGELVSLAGALLAAAHDSDVNDDPAVVAATALLAQVVDQDVEADDDGPAIRGGVARDRVVSHSDPEMRHGRKSASRRLDGHKLDVLTDESSPAGARRGRASGQRR